MNNVHLIGGLFRSDWYNIPNKEGSDKASILRHIQEIKKTNKYGIYWGDELLKADFPLPEMLIDGLIVKGGLNIIAGKPKAGKSFLAIDMAVSCSFGGLFLGKFQTKKSKVLYLCFEDGYSRLKNRLNNYCKENLLEGLGSNVGFLDNFPKLNEGGIDNLLQIVETERVDVIFIDTLAKGINLNVRGSNEYLSEDKILSELVATLLKHNLTLIAVHHLKKGYSEGVESLSGSMAISGNSSSIILLSKDGMAGKMELISRDFDAGNYSLNRLPSGFWSFNGEYQETIREKTHTEILEYLADGEKSLQDIAEYLNKTKSNVRQILQTMIKKGLIFQSRYGFYTKNKFLQSETESLNL